MIGGCGRSGVINRGITLHGHGELKAIPNVAELSLTIQTRDPDNNSKPAIAANARKSDSVRDALVRAGLKPAQISTESFTAESVQPYTYDPDYRPKGKPYYQVTNSLLVTTKSIKSIGKLIDAAMTAGASSVDGVSYRFEDSAETRAKALSLAVGDVRTRASGAAKSGGVRLRAVSRVVEASQGDLQPAYRPALERRADFRASKIDSQTYVSPKAETIDADVVVTFAIEPL